MAALFTYVLLLKNSLKIKYEKLNKITSWSEYLISF